MAFLALAVISMGDRDRADRLYRLLLPYADRPVVLGAGGAVWPTGSLYLGLLAATSGDRAAAQEHLAHAIDWLATWGATPWLAMATAARDAVGASPEAPQPA